jgi:hypothetical protein
MILPPIFSSLNFTAELPPPESNQKALIPVVGKITGIEKIKEHNHNTRIFVYPVRSKQPSLGERATLRSTKSKE